MTEWHMKSRRKPTGGMLTTHRRSDKKLAWKGGDATHTTLPHGEKGIVHNTHTHGGNEKQKLKKGRFIQLSTPGEGKVQRYEVLEVLENDANRQYARRNTMTRGAVVRAKGDQGEVFARITSRPGQSGMINGIIVEGSFGVKARKEDKKAAKKAKEVKKSSKQEFKEA